MPKNVKEGPLKVFEHPFFCKIEKNEGDPLETLKKFAKKSLTKPKNLHKKFLVKDGTRTNVLLLGRPQKAVTSMPSASRSSVAQFSVSASQLIKLIKSVSSLVFKKVTAIVYVFYEKRRLKGQDIHKSTKKLKTQKIKTQKNTISTNNSYLLCVAFFCVYLVI